MDKVLRLIEQSFEKRFLDKTAKKELKNLIAAYKLSIADLNLLSKKSFELYKQKSQDEFLLDCLQDIQNVLNQFRTPKKDHSKVCFSPKNKCFEKICKFIDKAEQSLLICVFTISDDNITQSILNAHKRGLAIKIITDNDKSMDRGSDVRRLASEGINVKIDMTRHHMHHKFAIRDNKALLTGSYNWTRSAEVYNQENFIITKEKYLIKSFRKEFDKLWNEMSLF